MKPILNKQSNRLSPGKPRRPPGFPLGFLPPSLLTLLFLLAACGENGSSASTSASSPEEEPSQAQTDGSLPSPSGAEEPDNPAEPGTDVPEGRPSQANPAYFHGPAILDNPRGSEKLVAYSYDYPVEFGSTVWGDVIMNGLAMASETAGEKDHIGVYTEDKEGRVLYSLPGQIFRDFMAESIGQEEFIDALEMSQPPE